MRKIVKVKRSALKSITEDSIDNSNKKDHIDLNNLNDGSSIDDSSNDPNDDDNDDDSSNDSSGEDVIFDEKDAPQSQNLMTAFAPCRKKMKIKTISIYLYNCGGDNNAEYNCD